jgi:hypothetical protein
MNNPIRDKSCIREVISKCRLPYKPWDGPVLLILFLLYTVLSQCSSFGHSTIVIVLGDSKEIVVAADSLELIDTVEPNGITHSASSTCKIRQIGRFIFSHAGFDFDTATGVSVDEIAARVFSGGGSDAEIASRLESTFFSKLTTVVNDAVLHANDVYRQRFENKVILAFMFVGYRGDSIVFHERQFTASSGTPFPTIKTERGDGDDVEVVETVLGNRKYIRAHGEIEKSLMLERARQPNKDKVARRLIEMEIRHQPKNRPREIGEPIDIMRLTPTGAEWIQKNKQCQDIQSPLMNSVTKR